MAERTISVTCRDCGTTFDHTTRSNRPRLLCVDCALEARRRATREHKRRIRAAAKVRHANCPHCGVAYSIPRARLGRCDDCRKAYMRDYLRRYHAANAGPARRFFCVTCDAEIERVGKSGRPSYCPPCAAAARRATATRAEAKRTEKRGAVKSTHCHYCADELAVPYYSGKHPARCGKCKRARHYAYTKARTDRSIANARCVDCGQSVALKRKGPRRIRCRHCVVLRQRQRWRTYAGTHGHMRRARLRGSQAEKFTKASIFVRDGWRCGICGRKIRRSLEHPHPLSASLDHIVPLSRGGRHSRDNVRATHLRCNLKKNARIENEQLLLFG
ncbi:HNH endonuclease [Verrucosispora sp. TAA-831]|uniref:HNH endonuclease n=1 Tax=Verrucosispora sp. TAA-831 TaxID=3422227 RepID=UPI003D6FEBBB